MDNAYLIVLLNSLKSAIILSLYSENAWFAALNFGNHNLLLITLMAVIGSTIGASVNFGIGYFIGTKKDNWYYVSDSVNARLMKFRQGAIYALLLPLCAVPVISSFWELFVCLMGILRTPPLKAIAFISVGRIAYYTLYIMS